MTRADGEVSGGEDGEGEGPVERDGRCVGRETQEEAGGEGSRGGEEGGGGLCKVSRECGEARDGVEVGDGGGDGLRAAGLVDGETGVRVAQGLHLEIGEVGGEGQG